MIPTAKPRPVCIDSGRYGVKTWYGGNYGIIPAVIAMPFETKTEADLTKKDYLWAKIYEEGQNIDPIGEWLVGELAVTFTELGIQERDRNKTNQVNQFLVLAALASLAQNKERIDLTINLPVRDFKSQKDEIKNLFRGKNYIAEIKAGPRAGTTVEFFIERCRALPEGVTSVYGWAYDERVELVRPIYFGGDILSVDVGDHTINFDVFRNGTHKDQDSGTIDEGNHKPLWDLTQWLIDQGRDVTMPEVSRALAKNISLYIGNKDAKIRDKMIELQRKYSQKAYTILANKFNNFTQFQRILFAGGAGTGYATVFRERLSKVCDIDMPSIEESIFLNVKGMRIMNALREAGRER